MITTTMEEPSMSTDCIPLQLTKLRDTKHTSNETVENILDVQIENKVSPHKFDIKKADEVFDDLPLDESCLELHSSRLKHMDIFAEYESEESRSKRAINSETSSAMHSKDDETNEDKTSSLKLIPKQLLIRRSNEQVKSKSRILDTSLQDPLAAALLTIQKKLLESHALKQDDKETKEESVDQIKPRYSTTNSSENLVTVKLLDRTDEFDVAPKSSVITRRSKSPVLVKSISVRSEQPEDRNKVSKSDDVKKYKTSSRNDGNVQSNVRSPIREQRKRSPSNRKESEKRYSRDDYTKDKKDRKSDDAEKSDRRDSRSAKDFTDSRRRTNSPGRGKRKRSRSPYVSWERQGSGSGSPGHSWSRSRSKSPRRKDENTVMSTRDRDKKRDRYDERSGGRSRTDEKRERYARSPPRSSSSYSEGNKCYNAIKAIVFSIKIFINIYVKISFFILKLVIKPFADNFKKHCSVSSKTNRDDWSRRRHDSIDRDREKENRSYDPIEMFRERTMESEKYRDNRYYY